MEVLYKPKILWAFVVGLGLVALAYHTSSPSIAVEPDGHLAVAGGAESGLRAPLPVSDSNSDGIEDWREAFVDDASYVFTASTTDSEYEVPDTVTAQMGIKLIQDIFYAKGYGTLESSKQEMVTELLDQVEHVAQDKLFDVSDVVVLHKYSQADLKDYVNQMGEALQENSTTKLENELTLLSDLVGSRDPITKAQIVEIANYYKSVLDKSRSVAVPSTFTKSHLDLLNVYQAIYNDIDTFTKVDIDPMLTLLRLKRYEDDVIGLVYALQNFQKDMVENKIVLSSSDPGYLFMYFEEDTLTSIYEQLN